MWCEVLGHLYCTCAIKSSLCIPTPKLYDKWRVMLVVDLVQYSCQCDYNVLCVLLLVQWLTA